MAGTGGRIRVVVVDDQLLVREGLRRIFDTSPEVELVGECADGDEVLDTVLAVRPDVVLMDVRMQRMSGAAAIELLAAIEDRPAVLVLTTFDDPDAIAATLRAGADGFLLKESVGSDLMRAVRALADGRAWIDPAISGTVRAVYRAESAESPASTRSVGELSVRELEVLRLLAVGRTNGEIANELFISERTVKTHVGHVFAKLDVRDRVAAVLRAQGLGLVDGPSRSMSAGQPR